MDGLALVGNQKRMDWHWLGTKNGCIGIGWEPKIGLPIGILEFPGVRVVLLVQLGGCVEVPGGARSLLARTVSSAVKPSYIYKQIVAAGARTGRSAIS